MFFLLIIVVSVEAQPLTWQRVYSSPLPESVGNGIQTFDGGYVVLATRFGSVGAGLLLLKLDRFGNEEWSKIVDSTVIGFRIRQCDDSSLIISGNLAGNGVLIKTNKTGDIIWRKFFHINNQYTLFRSVRCLSNGNLVICGSTSFPRIGFLIMMNSSGDSIWQSTFTSSEWETYPEDFCKSDDNFIYLTGSTEGSRIKTIIAKFSLNGDLIWSKDFGSNGEGDKQGGAAIVPISNQELLITGLYSDFYSTEAHFTKIDSSGNVIFQNVLPQTNSSRSMVGTTKGNFAIAGGLGTSSDDILFILINENGDILNRKLFNSSGIESDYSSSIFETSDNGFLITGYTTYLQSTQIDQNIYLIKTDSLGNAPTVNTNIIENQLPAGFKLYQNYPNPFNSSTIINFELNKSSLIKLEVYDITGKIINILANGFFTEGKYSVSFSSNKLSSGIYYYKLINNNLSITKKMMIIR